MNKKVVVLSALAGLATILFLTASSCDSPTNTNLTENNKTAQDRKNYVPKNDVEGRNYNARLQFADNPASLLWCSVYPTNPNVKPYTIPIAGKLTSGGKRPNPGTVVDNSATGNYYPDQADGQAMYGSSGEFRYGFDPAGNYHEFYNIETQCSSVPTVIMKNRTEIAITVSADLDTVDKQVEAALKVCRAKNPDPSVPCAEAARLLGV